jgi:WD40 repeat protein
VLELALTPDGLLMATRDADGELRLWGLSEAGGPTALASGKGGWQRLTFSPDGRALAAVQQTGKVRVWDVSGWRTGQADLPFADLNGKGRTTVPEVTFAAEGRALVVHGGGPLEAWALPEGRAPVLTLGPGNFEASLTPDGRALLVRWPSHPGVEKLQVYDLPSGRERFTISAAARYLLGARVCPAGDTLVIVHTSKVPGAPSAEVRLHDARTGALRRVLPAGRGYLYPAFSPDGQTLAGARNLGPPPQAWPNAEAPPFVLHLWDVKTGQELLQRQGEGLLAYHPVFSPDGQTLVVGGQMRRGAPGPPPWVGSTTWHRVGAVRLWEADRVRRGAFNELPAAVKRLVVSPDGGTLAVALAERGGTKLFPLKGDRPPLGLDARAFTGGRLAFSRGGRTLLAEHRAADHKAHSLKLWEVATGRELASFALGVSRDGDGFLTDGRTLLRWPPVRLDDLGAARALRPPPFKVGLFALASDGRRLAGVDAQSAVRVWDFLAGKEEKLEGKHPGFNFAASSLAFSPAGKLVAATESGCGVACWGVSSGKLLGTFPCDSNVNFSHEPAPAFSPDGKVLALLWAGNSREPPVVRLHDVKAALAARAILRGHTGATVTFAFAPDGRLLATGGKDGDVRLWRVADGASVAVYRGHRGEVGALAFTPEGDTLFSGGDDRSVRLWAVPRGR